MENTFDYTAEKARKESQKAIDVAIANAGDPLLSAIKFLINCNALHGQRSAVYKTKECSWREVRDYVSNTLTEVGYEVEFKFGWFGRVSIIIKW